MSNADIKQRFLFPDSDIRGEIVRLENTLAPALQQRGYPMAMEGLLSEAMAAVVLMAGTLKFRGRLSLQARGEGPVALLLAESTHDNGVRGIIQHRKDDGQYHSLADMLGDKAIMALTIRPDEGNQYQGVVPLEGEDLASCLAGYFNQSEQLPTRLWLAAGNGRAAGLLIQRLPDKVASAEDNALTWEHVITLADTLTMEELLDLPVETVLHRLFHEQPPQLPAPDPVSFSCTCSREKVANTLISLGKQELQAILDEQESVTISCDFCQSNETFDAVDLDQMIHALDSADQ